MRLEATPGIEPGYADLQSAASPLRHVASTDAAAVFLLNRYGPHWSEMVPSDILLVDLEGNVVDGSGGGQITAVQIHRQIHRARPDARCVMHTHMPYASAVASTPDTLEDRPNSP